MIQLDMIDLHTHTDYSDGRQSLAELLQKAESQNLEYLSITDHNTVDAYAELNDPKVRNLFSGKIIPGIEVEFSYKDTHNEFLGYGFDIDKISQVEWFTIEFRKATELKYVRDLYNIFNRLGFSLPSDEEIVKAVEDKGSARPLLIKTLESTENIAHAKEALGIQDANDFRKWRHKHVLRPGSKYEVERPKTPDIVEASKIIRDAGGLVFMAHIFRTGDRAFEMLDYAVENKLIDEIEAYYHDMSVAHTQEQIEQLLEYAKKHGLLVSGGSDCHRVENPLATIPIDQVGFVRKVATI